ncbi:anaerobic ribonucleoside triphosphate reductase [Muribaculum intestinale]|jgi:ribonucleoside-triphosphate reductase|uniref:Anaerobic ribonucleoside-triphosphate reductase n=2 Tax=Muribaculum intestinale TaxID=1796646 RepID=A0A1B1S7Q7_9BACT|nr:anaerobic ribonucleoside triphosphate reductase [Muribaculum intestinale]GFI67449.1 anaerobic ribonucleoside-triphosphate reductase [Muribaculaceae bacterium]ANU62819.1 anaerobic ribonucleoside-triphosphate reductase [Muribaculum intestinale]ASB36683.1 anaerobic ribonucleoside-triphosphate reductase [Muribaculum intestinale]PWB05451.1 anaerobic ribonucleoside triphosphate reductase [Muribaculum intestinale]PWB12029.1 anaerobic ribonucleoside triphosphate reductase [Muribaculum intestinale]
MIQTVVKRDGRVVGYNDEKIKAAIRKAMLQTEIGEDESLILKITDRISMTGNERMTVEEIQDRVEFELMKSPRKEVAKRYIAYRDQRNIARRAKTRDMFLEIIEAKNNDITRENANMNTDSPAGMMMKFASETTKPFVDDYLLSHEAREAVRNGYLHIHDKDYYPTKSLTCVQHPLDKILKYGFTAGHGESRPAKRIETASIIGCISLETAQNEMHGGQAIPAFDFYLAPFVRSSYIEEIKTLESLSGEDLSELYNAPIDDYLKRPLDGLKGRERMKQHAINETVGRVHQSMEAFIHNMNTIHSRGGNQVVFSSINYGTDTSAEGRCIIREILNSTYEGVGNGATAIFPIQIWKKKTGISYKPGDRNYDLYKLACKVTARRFFPNFLNLDATFNQHEKWRADDPDRYLYEVATMGCRTRVFENRYGEKTSVGRGNLSFSTINIVRIAIECMNIRDKEERIARFFSRLDDVLDITARQLCDRFDFQKTALVKQFPLLMSRLWIGAENLKPTDTIEPVINQGTLGIGFIGLAECLVALVGAHHGESDEAQELGLRIVSHMRSRVNEFCELYQHNFSVLATPAEGLSGKFTKKDRKSFGIIPGVTDRTYYTNSNHVPVYYHCSPRHKAKIEAPYHALTGGGHIFYVEIDGDATHNPDAISDIVDMMDKYNIGYGSVNHNRNRCMACGYEDAQDNLEKCPVCGSHAIDKLQRITGYLVGTTDRWNSAKLAELNDRVVHK